MRKIGIYFILMMFLFITGCKSSESKIVTSLDNFESVLTNENFTVTDKSDKYSEISYITGTKQAISGHLIIEMFEYTDVETAQKVHSEHIKNFNLLKSTGAHEINNQGQNFYKYALVSNGYYMISVQVDNTVIFCKAFLDNKTTIDGIFDKLGY